MYCNEINLHWVPQACGRVLCLVSMTIIVRGLWGASWNHVLMMIIKKSNRILKCQSTYFLNELFPLFLSTKAMKGFKKDFNSTELEISYTFTS